MNTNKELEAHNKVQSVKQALEKQIEMVYSSNPRAKILAKELVRFLIGEVFMSEENMGSLAFEPAPHMGEIQGHGNKAIIDMILFWSSEITADFIHVDGNFFHMKGEVI